MTRIEFALFCNIPLDDVGGNPDRRDEISFRPKTVGTPVVFLEDGKLFFNLARRVCLDEANHGAHRDLGWYGDQQVQVVGVMVRLFDVEFRIKRGDFEEFPVEILPEFWGDDGMSIFGRKDNVVIAQIDAMVVPTILLCACHPLMISG